MKWISMCLRLKEFIMADKPKRTRIVILGAAGRVFLTSNNTNPHRRYLIYSHPYHRNHILLNPLNLSCFDKAVSDQFFGLARRLR